MLDQALDHQLPSEPTLHAGKVSKRNANKNNSQLIEPRGYCLNALSGHVLVHYKVILVWGHHIDLELCTFPHNLFSATSAHQPLSI